VELKSGEKVEGTVKRADENAVKIEVGGQMVTFKREKVRAIYYTMTPAAAPTGAAPPAESPSALLKRRTSELTVAVREYRDSLDRLLAIHEQALAKAVEQQRTWRDLYDSGTIKRDVLEKGEQAVQTAQEKVNATRREITAADQAMAEATALEALAALPPPAKLPPRPPKNIAPNTPWIMWTHSLIRPSDVIGVLNGVPASPTAPRAWTPDWEKSYQTRAGCERAILEIQVRYQKAMALLGQDPISIPPRRCARTPEGVDPDGHRLPHWPANAPWGVDANGKSLPRLP
jgi:hypothetical protein